MSRAARRICFLFLLLLIIGVGLTSHSQDVPAWRAWLHDGSGRKMLINSAGETLHEITLPEPPIIDTQAVIISYDGTRIAYITRGSDAYSQQMNIYDVSAGEVIFTYLVEDVRQLSGAFAPHSARFALGVYLNDRSWYIAMIDLLTLDEVKRLGAETFAFPYDTDNSYSKRFHNIVVRRYGVDGVVFTISRNPGVSSYADPAFLWHPVTDTVTEHVGHHAFSLPDVFLPTGETITWLPDERFEAVGLGFGNILHVYDPITRSRFPFYYNGFIPVNSPRFVQNGQRILAIGHVTEYAISSFRFWLLLERDGRLVRLLRPIDRRDIHGTAAGFVYAHTDTSGHTQIIDYDTRRPFSDRGVWKGEGEWRILWVDSPTHTYGPFRPWAQLAEPVYDEPVPHVIIAPTSFPTPIPLLYPGIEAIVQTRDGEVLYLRAAPGRDQAILMHLLNRMRVEILEGPQRVDGFTWWRIRTRDGTEGWAVEAFDDVTTLLPAPATP